MLILVEHMSLTTYNIKKFHINEFMLKFKK